MSETELMVPPEQGEDVVSPAVSPSVWLESLFQRIVQAEAGRGGLESILAFLDNIHWIEELTPLRQVMKSNTIDFEAALAKCSREQRQKRPLLTREEEASDMLGCSCADCGLNTTFYMRIRVFHGKCPECGGKLKPLYWTRLKKLYREGLNPEPEAVLMDVVYDRVADAFVAAYKALRIVLDDTAKQFGWDEFQISNPQYRDYLDKYQYHRHTGETKIPREEKETFQFLARGSIANIPVEDAEQLIKLSVMVVKYGYLYEVLGVTGARLLYSKTVAERDQLYNKLNAEVDRKLLEKYGESETAPSITVSGFEEGKGYPPCLVMDPRGWESGTISKNASLKPLYKLPVFTKSDFGALETAYGLRGSGKTFLLSSIFCYTVLQKRELIFTPLGDKTNSFTLACLPFLGYSRTTEDLLRSLEFLEVEPKGIPVLTLTILRKEDRLDRLLTLQKHPPTKYDRLVVVENTQNFTLDFKEVVKELKEIAGEFGYSRPVGVINVRNLLDERFDREANTSPDAQIAANMLGQFAIWRRGNISLPARVFIDEVVTLARSKISLYARDILRSGETLLDFIAEGRRNNVSIDLATQKPLEILPSIRDEATNVFFRELPMSRDKTRSQIDFLLESLQLNEPAIRPVVRELNNSGVLGTGFWFWYHRPARAINVIRPNPPSFCILDPERPKTLKSNYDIFRFYEKQTGDKVLLDSWDEVKELYVAGGGEGYTAKLW